MEFQYSLFTLGGTAILTFSPAILGRLQFMKKTAREENRKCIHCGAGPDHLALLNPGGESRGGVDGFYYRCGQCKRYFVEYRIGGKVKMVRGS